MKSYQMRCLKKHLTFVVGVCLVSALQAEARIKVLSTLDDSTVYTVREKPIIVNIDYPSKGALVVAHPLNACGPVTPTPPVNMTLLASMQNNSNNISSTATTDKDEEFTWILLVSWSENDECSLRVKAENAASAGYTVILLQDPSNFDNDSEPLTPLLTPLASATPSFDYGWTDASVYACAINPQDWDTLRKNFTTDEYYLSFEESNSMNGWFTYFILGILIIGAVCFTIGLSYVLVQLLVLILIWIRESIVSRIQQIRRNRRRRLPASQLKKIPIQQWNSDMLQDICSICLESFVVTDRVRILPCSHVFHQCCIDPWLLKQRRKCPNCKRKIVFPDENRDSDSSSDDERTPLLRRSSTRDSATSPRNFRSRLPEPVQQRTEQQGNYSHSSVPETYRAGSSTDREQASGSVHQPQHSSPNQYYSSINSSMNTSSETRAGAGDNASEQTTDIKGKVDQLCARMENVGRKIRKKVKTNHCSKNENDSSSDMSTNIQQVLVSVTVEPNNSHDDPTTDESQNKEYQPSSSNAANTCVSKNLQICSNQKSSEESNNCGLQVKVVPDCLASSPHHAISINSEPNGDAGESSILSDLNT